MDGQPRPADVAAVVESIDARTSHETAWMMRALMNAAWPGGHHDRSERAAVEWVRRWGPSRMSNALLDCACAHGRCLVCN